MARPLPQPQSLDDIADEVQVGSGERQYRRGHWAWTEGRRLQTWDPLGTPASWMTHEIEQALAQIEGPHERKKRCTVLRLAEARALGLGVRSAFDQSDTCNAVTWYGREGVGWKDDPAIAKALELATRRAQAWQDQEEVQRITLRQRQLALTQDELVDLSKLATTTLADLMMNAGSEKVRLEAAETVLDRADAATAKKSTVEADIAFGDRKGPTMSEIRRRQRRRGELAHMDEEDEEDEEANNGRRETSTQLVLASSQTVSPAPIYDDDVEWVSAGTDDD